MQLVCALIGFCSILAMQKQKRASASLFDRRKRINDNICRQGTNISNAATTSKVGGNQVVSLGNVTTSKVGGNQVVSLGNVELV